MPIVDCSLCGPRMKLTDEQAARSVKCPKYQGHFTPEVIPVAKLARPADPPPCRTTPVSSPPPAKPPSQSHKVVVADNDEEVAEGDETARVFIRSRRDIEHAPRRRE